jgi:K+-sensing histidine kinase KdpD
VTEVLTPISHDMRAPLGNLRGATEVALARSRSREEYETLLASNLEECERLSRMIENLLFLARAEHPQFVRHCAASTQCRRSRGSPNASKTSPTKRT